MSPDRDWVGVSIVIHLLNGIELHLRDAITAG